MSPSSCNVLRDGDVQPRLKGIIDIATGTQPSQCWYLDLNASSICLQCSFLYHHAELLPRCQMAFAFYFIIHSNGKVKFPKIENISLQIIMGSSRWLGLAFLFIHEVVSHLTFRKYNFKKSNIWIKMNAQSSHSDHHCKINELISAI